MDPITSPDPTPLWRERVNPFCVDTCRPWRRHANSANLLANTHIKKNPGRLPGESKRGDLLLEFPLATHRQDTRGKRRELKHAGNHRHTSTVNHPHGLSRRWTVPPFGEAFGKENPNIGGQGGGEARPAHSVQSLIARLSTRCDSVHSVTR